MVTLPPVVLDWQDDVIEIILANGRPALDITPSGMAKLRAAGYTNTVRVSLTIDGDSRTVIVSPDPGYQVH